MSIHRRQKEQYKGRQQHQNDEKRVPPCVVGLASRHLTIAILAHDGSGSLFAEEQGEGNQSPTCRVENPKRLKGFRS